MRRYLHEILTLLGKDKTRVPGMLLLFLLVSMLDIAGIGLIGPYVTLVINPEIAKESVTGIGTWLQLPINHDDLLIYMSFFLLAVFLIKAVAAIWVNYIIIRFSVDQQVRLRAFLMNAYQNLSYTDYLSRNSAEYIHSTQSLVNQYASNIITSGMRTLSDGIVACAILVLLAWSNMLAFLLLVGLLGTVLFGYDRLMRKSIQKLGAKANIAATRMVQGIHEGIEGLKEIRILGHEKYFLNKVEDNSEKHGQCNVTSTIISTAPRYLLELIMVLFVVLLVLIMMRLHKDPQLLFASLAMFGVAAIRLLPAANILSTSLMKIRFSRDGVSRLYLDVVASQSQGYYQDQLVTDQVSFNLLSVSDVSYSYPSTEREALSHLNIEINAGESIGFIGASGAGKTTLVDVLLGLLEPQHGEISFNGKPLSKALPFWRNHVAYLPQQVFLIDNSLRRNVALGIEDKDIDDLRLVAALEKARLTELVEQLPEGVDTLLGERGARLSGGQRQRVALARAFYHERDVLVMDEATSALDNETEKEIVEEIKRLKGKKTIVIIAHRLTTVQHCDRIYKLEKGKIVAAGRAQEILNLHNVAASGDI
ncbi:MAG: ABC transporter ATP-binding protein [Candidatus Marinimicrobia bacterium]|jgi:ATP-binding cassette, subfamily B, bacterial PglK|nr:ABC transporter ATP-binding protein [Candidatus Neomarinimicrobiota bacterium]